MIEPHLLTVGDVAFGTACNVRPVVAYWGTFWLGRILLDEHFTLDPEIPTGSAEFFGFWSTVEIADGDQVVFDLVAAPFGLAPDRVHPGLLFESYVERIAQFCTRRGLHQHASALREAAEVVANPLK